MTKVTLGRFAPVADSSINNRMFVTLIMIAIPNLSYQAYLIILPIDNILCLGPYVHRHGR